MSYWKAGLTSLAASGAFVLLNELALSLAPLYKWAGALAIFVISIITLRFLPGDKPDVVSGGDALRDIDAGRDLDVLAEDVRIAPGSRTLSGIHSGRDTKITVTKSDL